MEKRNSKKKSNIDIESGDERIKKLSQIGIKNSKPSMVKETLIQHVDSCMGNEVSEKAKNKINLINEKDNKNFIKNFFWGLNWNEGDVLRHPSGFVAVIKGDAVLNNDLFEEDKIEYGTRIVKLQNCMVKDENGELKPLSIKYLNKNMEAIKKGIESKFSFKKEEGLQDIIARNSESKKFGLEFCENLTKGKFKSSSDSKLELGGGSSPFIGIYKNLKKKKNHYKDVFYLAVQTGLPNASREFIDHIEDIVKSQENLSQNEKTTFSQFFHSKGSKTLDLLQSGNSIYRKMCLNELASIIGITPDSYNKISNNKIVDVAHYTIRPDGSDVSYHSNTTHYEGKNTFHLNETPLLGFKLFDINPNEFIENKNKNINNIPCTLSKNPPKKEKIERKFIKVKDLKNSQYTSDYTTIFSSNKESKINDEEHFDSKEFSRLYTTMFPIKKEVQAIPLLVYIN
jgi:hypothetical protein